MEIFDEKKYKIRTNKNNEMDLFLRNINNEELSITLFTNYPSKKYELKCNLEEFQKNRFFKIFINIEEIMKELENKIEKSIFIEDTNCIIIEIKIGLTIINEILLVIEEQEKNKDDTINYLIEKNKELEKIVKELKDKLADKDKIIELEKFRKIKEEEEKKKEEFELIQNENKLEKRIIDLKKELADKEQILKDIKEEKEEEKAKNEESKLKSNLLVI